MKTIATVTVGSHLHGLAHPGSDVDVRAVYMDSFRIVISPFESESGPHGTGDFEAYELRKFVKLCAVGNPTALEILWSPLVQDRKIEWLWLTDIKKSLLDAHRVARAHIGYIDASIKAIEKADDTDKRLKKRFEAGLRIANQAVQLLTTMDFEPRLSVADPALADFIKGVRADDKPVDGEWADTALAHLAQAVKDVQTAEANSYPYKADLERVTYYLERAYMEGYSHQAVVG